LLGALQIAPFRQAALEPDVPLVQLVEVGRKRAKLPGEFFQVSLDLPTVASAEKTHVSL